MQVQAPAEAQRREGQERLEGRRVQTGPISTNAVSRATLNA
jgi:hypothetical protein